MRGNSVLDVTDVGFATGVGNFEFRRSYSSRPGDWVSDWVLGELPKPFGTSHVGAENVEWWHNYVSAVTVNSPLVYVRLPGGALTTFVECTAPCANQRSADARSSLDELETTTAGFVLRRSNGEYFVFEGGAYFPANGSPQKQFFLTEILNESGNTTTEVIYETPTEAISPDGGIGRCFLGNRLPDAGLVGIPFIKEVRTTGSTVRFLYTRLPRYDFSDFDDQYECVIRSINVVNPQDGGVLTPPLAEYSYVLDGGVETSGRIASVTYPDRSESYVYGSTGFVRQMSGGEVSTHTYTAGRVTSDVSSEGSISLSWADAGCPAGSECCGHPVTKLTEVVTSALIGDGGSGWPGFKREHLALLNNGQSIGERVLQRSDSCDGGAACSEGTVRTEWVCSTDAGVPGYEKGNKNKRDNWEQYTWAAVDAGTGTLRLEKTGTLQGASTVSSTDSLENESYAYVYGSNGQQLLSTVTRPSVLSSGNNAVTKNWYDSNNRLIKVTKSGYTVDNFYNTVNTRVIATFYSHIRSCGGTGTDPLGRTLEIRGPCVVSSTTATECPYAHPVTAYEYYSNTATGFNRNQLYKVHRWVNGSDDCTSGMPLTTTYSNYTATGKPGTVNDENGNDTTYTYDTVGNVLSKTIASLTTRYAYENGKLARVMYPEGNGEVYCYRTSSNADCTTGSYTPKLQWKAKKACSGTTSFTCTGDYSERVDYTYNADGTYGGETTKYWNGSTGVVRKKTVVHSDAQKRPTLRITGDGADAIKVPTFYDRADSVAGVGAAFNAAPVFCGGPTGSGASADGPLSALCTALKHDRAERLSSMTQYPTGSSSVSQTTCFGHDRNGNVTAVHSGCTATGCSTDGGVSGICDAQGPSKAAQYQYDDFGNVVSADLPWTSNGSGGKGRWTYVYDAMGNVIHRRNPEQVSHGVAYYTDFKYDKLGRNIEGSAWTDQGRGLMWYQYYDSASVPTDCPGPFSNAKGRLVRRVDGYGDTYYSYDVEGRVLKEVRNRYYSVACYTNNNRLYMSPHTTYTYTDNGNLKTIQYPQERQVEYVYGSGANKDRVTSVKVQQRESASWVWYTVLNNVEWEPYGELRGYQVTPPGAGSAAFTVEYRQGDGSESAPPSSLCTSSWTEIDDYSGRLRALLVSTGGQAMGTGTGEIYRRWYQWQGDVPVRIDSCVLQEKSPRTMLYGYDSLTQLLAADGGYPRGPSGLTGYQYDVRGNRTTYSESGASSLSTTYTLASSGDLMSSLSRSDTDGFTRTYTYKKDGRFESVAFGPHSGGEDSFVASTYSGEGQIFRTLSLAGTAYTYDYDVYMRRVRKQYPNANTDEFYYDLGHQLLADRGTNTMSGNWPWPVDDYVWLGGRPVVLVHGLIGNNWVRQNDNGSANECKRNDEPQACGFYFPVTDHLGTPVLTLDSSGRVTGAADLDPFGYPNRGALSAHSGTQPYAANRDDRLAQFVIESDMDAGLLVDARVKFAVVDTQATNDYVRVTQDGGSASVVLSSDIAGPKWTNWLTLKHGETLKFVNVDFVSNSDATVGPGVVGEAFEYRRYQSGVASPFFPLLRFPGQYHDNESDLFENWNRYYDPFTGRYLQPEPMLQVRPRFPTITARRGKNALSYAYALNNPMRFMDANGLYVTVVNAPVDFNNLDPSCMVSGGLSAKTCMRQLWNKFPCQPVPNSGGACGPSETSWKFDVHFYNDMTVNKLLRKLWDGESVETSGVSLGSHESLHQGDMRNGLNQRHVNERIVTEGFGSLAECNTALANFDDEMYDLILEASHSSSKLRD